MSALEKLGYAAVALSIVFNVGAAYFFWVTFRFGMLLHTWPARCFWILLTRAPKAWIGECCIEVHANGHVVIWQNKRIVSDSDVDPKNDDDGPTIDGFK